MPMKPLRRVARTLLATTFVAGGVNGLMNPKPRAAAAGALADQGRERLPDPLAAKVPDDPSRLVRVNSAAQVAGGLLLLSGRAPRPAAVVLAATVVPGTLTEQDFWAENDPDRKAAKQVGFLKDLGLLGGLLIAAADTEGKPSLGWRGRRAVHSLVDRGPTMADQVRDEGTVLLDGAKGQGAHLAELARERGPQLGEAIREHGSHLAELARQRGAQLAEVAKERGPQVGEVVRERGAQLAEVAKERAARR
ncbi:DoxX family membrane protein [Nocardia rhizosphaerae]|uniref:DoxX family membrane protein n=1 Tax=Nocardia rhizosphaerae TaxID=1691571 RepID=A0ABV8L5T3_9NOCA